MGVPFRHATQLLRNIRSTENEKQVQEALGSLFVVVAQADDSPNEDELNFIAALFTETFGHREAKRIREVIRQSGTIDIEKQCKILAHLRPQDVQELIRGMIEVGFSDGNVSEAERQVIAQVAQRLGMDDAAFEQSFLSVQSERERRSVVVRSGAGILAALFVVMIFVFAATFLRSVLFGLALAYFFLPIQRWYQQRFFAHPLVIRIFNRLNMPILEDKPRLIARACQATFLSILVGSISVLAGLVMLYSVFSDQSEMTTQFGWLEQFRPHLENLPFFGVARQTVLSYLTDPERQKELFQMAFSHMESILLRAGGVLMGLMHLLLDAMLTLFFFNFFLQHIALGQSEAEGHQRSAGAYIVDAIFESGWLPDINPTTLLDAKTIIDDILKMLQTWVRGYVWIILIETLLYTVIFMFLRVPWFVLAGGMAGSAILVPVVGPVVGCALTVLATLTSHPHALTPAVGVVVSYAIIHGVIEQLFLYPSLVGKALGLNTLETIIVVLLGGVLAGLAGAIFAVPVAAILKRLIPKIYAVLQSRKA